jgi:Asp-tRNA(Asn)/Glu-tRNA(Gln) amidotransferase A subunit family amidase
MSNTDLCFLNVTELVPLVRARKISPVEIVQALLSRIDIWNDDLLAYLHVSTAPAMAAAQAAEIEIGSGGYRGPLHGIPVAYKDIYDVQGLPTTAGSKLMAGYIAPEDCTVAARLRHAGAICLGKLNTIEFASGSMEVFGIARNPWNTAMFPGGSSSGSGTALAAHMIPLATGSDTGGSIRNPASFCGIVGLKPTYGRISRAGIIPLSWSLDHAGPMARTVADTAVMLQAMIPVPRCNRCQTITPLSRATYRGSGSVSLAPSTSSTLTLTSSLQYARRLRPCNNSVPPCARWTCPIPATAPRRRGASPTPSHLPFTVPTSLPGRATIRMPFSTRSRARPVSLLRSASLPSVYGR